MGNASPLLGRGVKDKRQRAGRESQETDRGQEEEEDEIHKLESACPIISVIYQISDLPKSMVDFKSCGPETRTVILCDQCEKEFHVGSLKGHNMQGLCVTEMKTTEGIPDLTSRLLRGRSAFQEVEHAACCLKQSPSSEQEKGKEKRSE